MSSGFFVDDETAPAASVGAVADAERVLGYRLPNAYKDLLVEHDGGQPRLGYLRTAFPTSWDGEGLEIWDLAGLGTLLESAYLIGEWEYPDVGLVVGYTPSGGHEILLLDYTDSGPQGEPAVLYAEENDEGGWDAHRVAPTFSDFVAALVEVPEPG